ncbi:hypothetical protein GGI20_001019 [Coemansia sp. BCRC 34301]|nr:hypothetical protein GGI20_001019 [Coemansia sp. BCRC 34301]
MADPFAPQPHSSSDDIGRNNNNSNPTPPHHPAVAAPRYNDDRASYSAYEYSDYSSSQGRLGTESPASEYGQYFSAATNGGFQSPNGTPMPDHHPRYSDTMSPYMQPYQQPPYQQAPYAMRGLGSDATALNAGGQRSLSSEKVGAPLLLTGAAVAGMEDADKSPASYKAHKRKSRRCCGGGRYCFCFSKRCCLIFIPILIIILAGLGVTLYYVFPRIPTVKFKEVGVAKPDVASSLTGKETPSVSELVDGVTISRKGVVTVPLVIHLTVSNPNFIPWTIHNVTVTGYLRNPGGGDNFPVGEGGLRTPFWMPKKSEGNDMPIYFNFRLDTAHTNYIPAAQTVQQACTLGGPKLRFYYRAQVILRAISWLGIKPTISDNIEFECPISQINDLGIQINDLTGLGTIAA